ncbi:MAG TPA: Hint domain-containing protein [Actinomycetota bacterium]|nr:Hint domain-containing protein [Actinomycetota bacterium]
MSQRRIVIGALSVALAMSGCTRAGEEVRPSPRPTPTPTPTLGEPVPFAPASLQFIVLDRFGPPVACDPDTYPVGRADGERHAADQWWSELNVGSTHGRAIIDRLGWAFPPSAAEVDRVAAYREYKKLRTVQMTLVDRAYQFEINAAPPGGSGSWDGGPATRYVGFILPDGRIESVIEHPIDVNCPVCLDGETRIRVPGGERPVRLLRQGDPVLSVGRGGETIVTTVRRWVRRPAHGPLLAFELADRRRLRMAGAHPLPDGRPAGMLAPGDELGGSRILRRDAVEPSGGATYDILPDGPTGHYWANGILVASTITASPRPERH